MQQGELLEGVQPARTGVSGFGSVLQAAVGRAAPPAVDTEFPLAGSQSKPFRERQVFLLTCAHGPQLQGWGCSLPPCLRAA